MDKVERKALREEAARVFGQNLTRERKKRGLSQVGLAKKAGLNRTHVGFLESGKRSPVLNTIKLLAKALEVGSGVLIDDPDFSDGKGRGGERGADGTG
jgi:transcriptional regulator with XRE-family HTH domain